MNTVYQNTTAIGTMESSRKNIFLRIWIAQLLKQLATWLIVIADMIDIEDIKLNEQLNVEIEVSETSEVKGVESKEIIQRERKDTVNTDDSGLDFEIPDLASGKDEETGLDLISLEEVSYHCLREDAWIVVYDKVYEMTDYLETSQHPGGEDVILEYLGYDATLAFRGVAHSRAALRTLDKYCIGILPSNERLNFSSE